MTNNIKSECFSAIFFVMVVVLFSANINAEVIDFETVPGVGTPTACLEISNQYQALYGIVFSLEGGGYPRIAKVGSPREGFEGPGNGDDNPVPGQNIGNYFLTDDCLFGSITSPPLIISYNPPTSGANGVILDIDWGETFTIQARGASNNILQTIIIRDGDPNTGDGIATPWSFNRASADIYSIRFAGVKQGASFGLGFDNFSARPAPVCSLQFSAPTYNVNEGAGTATITVTRTGGSSGAASVNYTTSNGTATADSDYTATPGTLNWADGVTGSKTFVVPIINDTDIEGNETVNLTLSNPSICALGTQSTAVLTIADNDVAAPPVAIPTMTEWGMILFMVLAGAGVIYFLRKQRGQSVKNK